MASLKKPAPLKKGDTVAVVAPASPFDQAAFMRGVQRIESWGFKVQVGEGITERRRYLAGDDERRFRELERALTDPQVKAIFAARGGYGTQRLLPALEKIPTDLNPKILLGYSDLTSLLLFARQRWGWVTFHGPVVSKDIGDRLGPEGEDSLLRALTDPQALGTLSPPGLVTLAIGRAEGPLVGGCLSLLVCSLGTPYQIQTEGCVLFIEDVGELLYSLDRMLFHLRLAGIFQKVRGIVFGPLKDAHDSPEVIQGMLRDVLGDLGVPMVFGFPSGHTEDSWTIPLGLPVRLDADEAKIEFPEGALEV
ncbi:MAG: LD-carboxypeptidase [bacterium]|nr:LD-carboxypeptidase [bacterium]